MAFRIRYVVRSLALFLLFACSCLSIAQHDTYGKSEAQILAMGQDKWEKFYSAKAGNSTMAMSEMKDIFGEAAKHRNDKLIAKASPAVRKRMKTLRNYMNDLAQSAVDVAYNISGGGTMWAPVSAGIAGDLELTLYPLLVGKGKAPSHVSATAVPAELEKVRKAMVSAHGTPGFDLKRSMVGYGRMRVKYFEISRLLKNRPRSESDRVLGFCRTYAHMAIGDFS